MRLSNCLSVVLCVLGFGLFTLLYAGNAKEPATEKSPLFTLKTLTGENYSLEKNLGRGPIVINFWATWCGPCFLEMKSMKKVYDTFAAKGVQFLSIAIDDNKTQPQIPGMIRTYKIPFTILLDGNKEVFKRFQGTNPPNLFILDKNGMLVYKHSGYIKGDEKKVGTILADLLAAEKIK
jgi:peroxiredoxin